MNVVTFIIIILILFTGIEEAFANPVYPVTEKEDSPGVYVQILPRLELLSGVLSQTTWMEVRGPWGEGNRYFSELKGFFEDYRDHPAIKIAQKLTDRGFTYDAPIDFMLRLGPLPDLEASNGYTEYLVKRAGGSDILDEFRYALKELAEQSDFYSFISSHSREYARYIDDVEKDLNSKRIVEWMNNFYGWKGSRHNVIIAPGMFPGGGYGINVQTQEGQETIFYVMRESGRSVDEPQFVKGVYMGRLALHEWGHSFVNPSFGKYSQFVKRLEPLYREVEGMMKSYSYNSVEIFINEQVIRAVNALAIKELYGYSFYRMHLETQRNRGFYLTEYTIDQLKYYMANRGRFKRFDEFVPYLLDQYYRDMNLLIDREQDASLKLASLGFVLVLAFIILMRKRFKKTIKWA